MRDTCVQLLTLQYLAVERYIYMRRRCIYWVDDGTNSRSKSRACEGASIYDMYTYMIYIYTYVY
jgi:hypothetical protein